MALMVFSVALAILVAKLSIANAESLYDPDNLWLAYEKCKANLLGSQGRLCDPGSRLDAQGVSDIKAELARFRDLPCVCNQASDCTQ